MVTVPAVGGMSKQLLYLNPHETKGPETDLEPLLFFSEVFSLWGPGSILAGTGSRDDASSGLSSGFRAQPEWSQIQTSFLLLAVTSHFTCLILLSPS